MKRSITLLLPLLLVLASCGNSAQFSQQRYQDGIYTATRVAPGSVVLKTEDDFRREALRNIREQEFLNALDSLKIEYRDVYPGTFEYEMYFSLFPIIGYGGFSWAFNNWYWNRWHLGWDGFGPYGIWDPFWIGSRFDWYTFRYGPFGPWLYDPWYGPYSPWYYRWRPGYYRPWYIGGGGGFRHDVYYTPRNTTQPMVDRHHSGSAYSGSSMRYGGGRSASDSQYKYESNYHPRRAVTGGTTSQRSSGGYTPSTSSSRSTTSSGSYSGSTRSYRSASGSGSSSRSSSYGSSSRSSSYSSSSRSSSSSSYSGGSRSGGSSYSGGGGSRGGGSHAGSGGRR